MKAKYAKTSRLPYLTIIRTAQYSERLPLYETIRIMKNLILFSRRRHEKSMAMKLASEIMAAYKEEGSAFKKKEDTHRMAEANKAFSHFRF